MFLQHPPEIQAVIALGVHVYEALELRRVDEALGQGDLLDAGDLEPLAVLDGADKFRGFEQGVVGSGVEPSVAAPQFSTLKSSRSR